MKKKNYLKMLFVILLTLSCLLFISSCGKKTEQVNSDNQNTSFQGTSNRMGQFRQPTPDLYGEVKSISGSKVTLALLEIQQRAQLTPEQRQKMQGNANNNNMQNGNTGNQNQGTNNSNRRQRNGGAGGYGGRNGGGFGGGFGGARKYTGKTETIDITSDIKITTFDRSNGNFEQKTLQLSDIKVGSLLQAWYKTDSGESKQIESIRVISNMNNNNNNNNSSNGNSDNSSNSGN